MMFNIVVDRTNEPVATKPIIPDDLVVFTLGSVVTSYSTSPVLFWPTVASFGSGSRFTDLIRYETATAPGLIIAQDTPDILDPLEIEILPKRKNQEALKLLDEWMATPDELGPKWWADFEKDINGTLFGE